MVDIHLTAFSAETRERALARMISDLGLTHANLIRDENHKPFLQASDGQIHGLAITHIRSASTPFSLMAASTCSGLGLDAELWNPGLGDDTFLNSVMAKEEAKLAATLKANRRHAGVFLWVGKEAALKASGTVMVDPRHVTLRQMGPNHFRAEPSRAATAPITPANMWFYTFTAPQLDQHVLLAVAVADNPQPIQSILLKAEKLPGLVPLHLDSI